MTLVVAIGGVRSGKSAWAEQQAMSLAGEAPVTILATADPSDHSMTDRIALHVARRPTEWPVVDLHGRDDLASALPLGGVALLDGLGNWVAGVLDRAGAFSDDAVEARSGKRLAFAEAHAAIASLIDAAADEDLALVVVSEETGLGVVPMGIGTAAWVDLVGELNQQLVGAADLAVVVVAGRALPLSDGPSSVPRPEASGPLTVVTSTQPPRPESLEERERRAHPRLLGADRPRPRLTDGTTTLGNPDALQPAKVHVIGPDIAVIPPAGSGAASGAHAGAEIDALRVHGDRLVRPGDADHAVNVVAEGPPQWLLDALEEVKAEALTRYPNAAPAELALANLYGRTADEVVATNGAADALWLLPAALRPRLAACVHPLFTEAEAALRAHGVPVVRVLRDPEENFAFDPAAVPADADLVLIGNPAAASGSLTAREAILACVRPGRTVVVDEAFMDLVPGEAESLAGERIEGLIVVRSFTKSLAIPGVRCGAAIASAGLAAQLRAVQPPWSVNAFAVRAITALAEHPDELPARARRASIERAHLEVALGAINDLRQWPSATNHLLIQLPDGAGVAAALRARKIVVRPCGSFPGLTDDHLRITAREPAANARLAAALADILAPEIA